MPKSLIERLPGQSTIYPWPASVGGGNFTAPDRRTEMLRKISAQSIRLRGYHQHPVTGNQIFGSDRKGRSDALRVLLVRAGIIPIPVGPVNPPTTLHLYIQAYPAARASEGTITVTGPTVAAVFSPGGPAVDSTFAATGQNDLAATSSLDADATGKARIVVT